MFEVGPQASGYLTRYANGWADLDRKAGLCEGYFKGVLKPTNIDLHLVSARAKTVDSTRDKVLRKRYGHPAMQLTDAIGVRVITYFASDVDSVAAALRDTLDLDERHSSDKRSVLALREFGYRSVHLVGRIRGDHLALQYRPIAQLRVEIQIRSVLEHAWAEIEHEVVYKAGIDLPEDIRRRFSAIAGTLELLESEFDALRRSRAELIDHHKVRFDEGLGFDEPLDASRLIAVLEVLRPGGLSWRAAEQAGQPFPPRIEATCTNALAAAEVRTGGELRDLLTSEAFSQRAHAYAAARGTVPSTLSHLSVAVIATTVKDEGAATAFLGQLADEVLGAVNG